MALKSIEIIKFGYSDDYAQAQPLQEDAVVNVRADGTMMAGTSQNYFYLFVPWAERDQHTAGGRITPSAATITAPAYVTAENQDTLIANSWTVSPYSPDEPGWDEICYGYYKYKVAVSPNPATSEREGNVTVKFIVDTLNGDWATPEHSVSQAEVTVSFKVKQDGIESHDEPSTSDNYYYRVDTQLTSLNAPLTQYQVVTAFPQTISDGYSYKSSEVQNINAFKYVYVRTVDDSADQLAGYSEANWARLVLAASQGDPCVKVFQVQVDQSAQEFSRSTVLSIKKDGASIVNIYIMQYGTSSGDDPEIPDVPVDADEAEDKYWEGEGSTGSFIITDTNEGAIIDSTQLLFKSNYANIYNTIEQKDGTLFLGNYINENTINNVHDIMNLYIATDKIVTSEGVRKIPVNLSGASDYSYIPDMTQNSQQKRVFKYGETYALGLVFVYKTGTWSSVYYLGENRDVESKGKWTISNPLQEPSLISEGGSYHYNKPVKYCVLSEEVTNALAAQGVIAVIPVYAVKNSHRIMCQGFLSPTLQSSSRQTAEAIQAQYSWFYRNAFTRSQAEYLPSGIEAPSDQMEIQNLDASINSPTNFNAWMINRQICSLNTPEVEADEVLSNAMLQNAQCQSVKNYTGFKYVNGISLQVNGKYLKSYFSSADVFRDGRPISSITERRVITGYIWHGFRNDGFNSKDGTLLDEVNKEENYLWFAVYPWQRSIIGGEGPTSSISNKRLFNSLYLEGTTVDNTQLVLPSVVDAAIYRDFDTASIIRVGTDIYQGNTDYIAVTEQANAYKAWTSEGREAPTGQPAPYPHAHEDDGNYAGYDVNGYITDPISIKYKTAPHIAIKFSDVVTYKDKGVQDYQALFCVELLNPQMQYKTDTQDLQGYQWIKCGDLKRILPTEQTIVLFEEGDYFYGRFDSLRTYCYTEEDVNSVVEVVSGMLCSRVNLDSRCDRNRGVRTPTVTPENFNIFNPVYNQLNNYFTFSYINQGDIIYKRKYSNSIQWSLTKEYSSDIDNWCNIQDINTLDFDGDKGEIQSITKLGNNLIVFQDTGISQIQYNEKTQIATDQGVPIEIGNSNKVDGKYYLYDNVGCQYKGSISKSPNGIYFVDSINRTLYLLGLNSQLSDLCTVGGMKSWGLANLDRSWWSYYDINSQEILFANNIEALAYSDAYGRFNAFLGYGGIRWNFRINDRTVQICPANFTQVISTTSPTVNSNKRIPKETKSLGNTYNSFWKKNSIDTTRFFDNHSPIEIQLQCNPEPTIDKTFCVVEYRMDCFDSINQYLPEMSFNTFRAWDEYQDTLETSLKFRENQEGPVYSNVYSTRLRKKFRIWRLDIPRAYYGNTLDLATQQQTVPDLNQIVPAQVNIDGQRSARYSMDRIRNPWCNIYFKLNTEGISKVIFNDLSIHYFK